MNILVSTVLTILFLIVLLVILSRDDDDEESDNPIPDCPGHWTLCGRCNGFSSAEYCDCEEWLADEDVPESVLTMYLRASGKHV
jgi:hypothetical protein